MNLSNTDIERILTERFETLKEEKVQIRDRLDLIIKKIENQIALMGATPKEKEDELVAAIQKLEHVHKTTPQSTTDERTFMREMDKLKQKKKNLTQYAKMQLDLDGLKMQKVQLQSELREKENNIDELQNGLKKIRLSSKLGCNTTDILETKITTDEAKISRIVGKGGANLRTIETECTVNLEVDKTGGGIRITGTSQSIEAAIAAITKVVETTEEEISLNEETIICLLKDKTAMATEIMTTFNVRLDISRAKNSCKIMGHFQQVNAAKAHIFGIKSSHETIPIDPSAIPFIMGKGGSKIVSIQEKYHVNMVINRENNTIDVVGLSDDVIAVCAELKDLIEENREVEEAIELQRHILMGCLIGHGGQIIKNLNKDFGIRLDLDGNKQDALQTIKIKGIKAKVAAGKLRIIELIEQYISNTLTLEIPDDCMPIIMGKAGAGIKALREKYPTANIDIEENNVINVQSESNEVREEIKAYIESIVEANYSEKISLTEDAIIQLKSQKATSYRDQIYKDLTLKMHFNDELKEVRLRGTKDSVIQGIELLNEFMNSYALCQVQLNEDDYPAFFKGGDDSLVLLLQKKYSVEISSNRKESTLYIRGSPQNAEKCRVHVMGIIENNLNYGSLQMNLPNAVLPSLIGKNGANIRKMEEDFGVKFDFLKSSQTLRIRTFECDVALMEKAKKAIDYFVKATRVQDSVDIPSNVSKVLLDEVIDFLTSAYSVEISISDVALSDSAVNTTTSNEPSIQAAEQKEKTPKEVRTSVSNKDTKEKKIEPNKRKLILKGHFADIEEMKEYIPLRFLGQLNHRIFMLDTHCKLLLHRFYENFNPIQEKFGVKVTLNSQLSSTSNAYPFICVTGELTAGQKASAKVIKYLEILFPGEIQSLPISNSILRDLLYQTTNLDDAVLEKIKEVTETRIVPDRIFGTLRIHGSKQSLSSAVEQIQKRLSDKSDDNNNYVDIEEYMLPLIVGKNGAAINALMKEAQVGIDINRQLMRLEIKSTTKSSMIHGKELIQAKVDKLRNERWEMTLGGDQIGAVIGKQGATIKKIRTDSGAMVDVDVKTGLLKAYGPLQSIEIAKGMVLDIVKDISGKSMITQMIDIIPSAIPAIIGLKGATAKEIQAKSSARLDIDRNSLKIILKGTSEACAEAAHLIDEVLDREGVGKPAIKETPKKMEATPLVETQEDEPDVKVLPGLDQRPKGVPGASPSTSSNSRQGLPNLSKSALRRLKRKIQTQSSNTAEGENMIDGEQELEPDQIETETQEAALEKKEIDDADLEDSDEIDFVPSLGVTTEDGITILNEGSNIAKTTPTISVTESKDSKRVTDIESMSAKEKQKDVTDSLSTQKQYDTTQLQQLKIAPAKQSSIDQYLYEKKSPTSKPEVLSKPPGLQSPALVANAGNNTPVGVIGRSNGASFMSKISEVSSGNQDESYPVTHLPGANDRSKQGLSFTSSDGSTQLMNMLLGSEISNELPKALPVQKEPQPVPIAATPFPVGYLPNAVVPPNPIPGSIGMFPIPPPTPILNSPYGMQFGMQTQHIPQQGQANAHPAMLNSNGMMMYSTTDPYMYMYNLQQQQQQQQQLHQNYYIPPQTNYNLPTSNKYENSRMVDHESRLMQHNSNSYPLSGPHAHNGNTGNFANNSLFGNQMHDGNNQNFAHQQLHQSQVQRSIQNSNQQSFINQSSTTSRQVNAGMTSNENVVHPTFQHNANSGGNYQHQQQAPRYAFQQSQPGNNVGSNNNLVGMQPHPQRRADGDFSSFNIPPNGYNNSNVAPNLYPSNQGFNNNLTTQQPAANSSYYKSKSGLNIRY